MERHFKGKTVLLTGASSGIGQDLALVLAGWGCKLVLVARRAEKLAELAAACEAAGAEVQVCAADVADRARMAEVAREAQDRFGFVDIVIANAGVGGLNPARHFDLDMHAQTFAINVLGTANTLAPFIAPMVAAGRGQLVGVSSLAAFRGLPNAASYSSSKAAQARMLESWRVDLRPHGVAVSCIHPGFVVSPMTDHSAFTMPFMVKTRASSLIIARAIARRRAVTLYPWPMRLLTLLNRVMPCWLYDRLMPRLSGQGDDVQPRMF
ncbi:MAG: SDR family NAD(P)-dependent oxidoreductase [Pseudomonadota bacterium]